MLKQLNTMAKRVLLSRLSFFCWISKILDKKLVKSLAVVNFRIAVYHSKIQNAIYISNVRMLVS